MIHKEDKPTLRAVADAARLGQIPEGSFSALMDDAVLHATQTVQADSLVTTRKWRNLGPRNIGGRIRTLAIHPQDGRILYAGSALGGVWKTTNAGDSWQSLDDFRPSQGGRQALPIGALAVAQSDPQIVYVGTGEPVAGYISGNGLFWSRNGGKHFDQIDHPDNGVIQAKHYERIRVDPWESSRLWCATDKGLWRGCPGNPPHFVQDVIDAAGTPTAPANQQATDVVINHGDPRGVVPARFTVFVALKGAGVYRATFIRANDDYDRSGATVWSQVNISGLTALPGFHRVKLALCDTRPDRMYCVAGRADNKFSPVFISTNGGATWAATATQPDSASIITWYALVLECNPSDPNVVFLGQVDMWLTTDGGASWGRKNTKKPFIPNFLPCLDHQQYGLGDRAQHADQHAVVFDRDQPYHAWVANDGGVSFTDNLTYSWRKRSNGILATQFNDISTHPTYPFMMGGGLQDNGSWITYGGMSWYYIGHSDGGDIGFEPGNPRLFHVTAQQGVWRGQIATSSLSDFSLPNPAPDIPITVNVEGIVQFHGQFVGKDANGFATADEPLFYAVLVHHPFNNNEALIGRRNNAYRTVNGTNFSVMGHAAFNPYGTGNVEVSALAYGASPNNDWWVGTSRGEVFVTFNAGVTWRNATEPLGSRGNWISAIATHPANSNIAVIAVASSPGTVYITGDGGQSWLEISGRAGNGGANWQPRQTHNIGDQLSPSPATAIAFDPGSPSAVGSAQTLYVGTLTGVYVIRNVLAPTSTIPTPNFQPVWRTFNGNLPLVLVYEIEPIQFQDAGGNTHNKLRIATFGRGIYEVDLLVNSSTRLLIRRNIVDNGLNLPVANTFTEDPRLVPGVPLIDSQSIDIRVDAPPYLSFGLVADSVEFDQQLRSENLMAGKLHLIYVQVHNVGSQVGERVEVYLYWAKAIGSPPIPPDLPDDFWTGLPKDNAPPWFLIGKIEVHEVASGEPAVICFQWDVPGDIPENVALLALVTDNARDRLVPLDPAPKPPNDINNLIANERRAALRITTCISSPADALLRDGFDDQGRLGETAWAARSHDIIVVQAAVADPNTAFADVDDLRQADRLDGNETNHIYVRINNRGERPLNNIQVELFQIPLASVHDPNSWVSKGTSNLTSVAARSTGFALPIVWANPPNPAPLSAYLLAALVQADDDPRPDYQDRVDSIKSFWQLFLESVDSGNAALRGIRWQA
ncbi:hypothetical protein SAMN05660964_01445 [Thiothrix caldifontis]|uniref:Glycosyl hydrolase n=1 Tax=Thiothrix caldifontis TaxID=525918 RepID=A0A1H4APM9_9GAMM|nr:hypothetical protein [Thiothrix caldifontis]SEA37855.1 hypothetical protein SAMN05660964_01445 [Thiothrix caldifontis]